MNEAWRALAAVVAATFGLAVLSVVLSSRARSVQVIGAGSDALAGLIATATMPVR